MVKCLETSEIFKSLSEATRTHNVDRSNITKVCKGITQTAGGLHWKFIDESSDASADKEIKHLSAEHKALLSSKVKTKKPVICVETGKVYDSISEAARCHDVTFNNLKRACNEHNRTADGYHWRYIN